MRCGWCGKNRKAPTREHRGFWKAILGNGQLGEENYERIRRESQACVGLFVSNDALNWAIAQRLTQTQKIVLVILANRADSEWRCWPSAKALAEECSISERSVFRAIKELSEAGFVSVSTEYGVRSIYTLTPDTVSVPPCQPVTPDTVSPLTDSQVTPDTVSGDPCHSVRATRASSYEPKENPKEPKEKNTRARKPKIEKLRFGQFGNVLMTQEEHDKLMAEHGERGKRAIAKLDAFIGSKGDKYKSHYMAMFSWVLRAVDEDEARGGARASPVNQQQPPSRENDAIMRTMANAANVLQRRRERENANP